MANKRRIQEWLIKNKMWDYGERMERGGGIKQKGKCVCVRGGDNCIKILFKFNLGRFANQACNFIFAKLCKESSQLF